MVPAFNFIEFVIFSFVGVIIGYLLRDKIKISFNLFFFEDRITNLVFATLLFYAITLGFLSVVNSLFFNYKLSVPYFIETRAVDVLRAFAPVFLGAIPIILTRKEARENKQKEISKILVPIYYEIIKSRDDLLLNTYTNQYYISDDNFNVWNSIKEEDSGIRIKNINKDIPDYYTRLNVHNNKYHDIANYYTENINMVFYKQILSNIHEGRFLYNQKRQNIFIVYKTGHTSSNNIPIVKFVIFGYDPMDLMYEMDELFKQEDSNIRYRYLELPDSSEKVDELKFSQIEKYYATFISDITEILNKDNYVEALREERDKLIRLSDRILLQLENFI